MNQWEEIRIKQICSEKDKDKILKKNIDIDI